MRRSSVVILCCIVIGQFCERTRLIKSSHHVVVVSRVYRSIISKAQSEANPSCSVLVAAILAVPRTVEHSCTVRRLNTRPTGLRKEKERASHF